MALNRLRNVISFFLKLLSAFSCSYLLLLLSVEYLKILAGAPGWEEMIDVPINDGKFMGHAVGLSICLPPVIYCGAAFGRFLLRAAPPQLSGRVRLGALLISLLPILACTIFSGLTFCGLYIISSSASLPMDRSSLIGAASFAALCLIWGAACAFTLLTRHLKPLSFLDRPFVLFLRRFSKFSDRAVISLILRQTPPSKPVAFLVPTNSRAEDWNPFLVGFAGMKLLHPFRSVPVIVKSEEIEWKQAVKLLIDRAQIIILDISETSDAIEAEFEIISETACWQKMIFLKNDSAKNGFEFEQNIRPSDSQIIYYRASWIRGVPRMTLGVFVILVLLSQVSPLFSLIALISGPIFRILFLLFVMLVVWWIHFSFFGHSSIDRASKISLRKMLRADRKSKVHEHRA